MTPAERAFWMRAQRRAHGQQPDIAAAILRAFEIIRDSLTDAELERLIASGRADQVIQELLSEQVMDRAFIPLRQRIRTAVDHNVKYFARDLPKGGRVGGEIAVAFDVLNPKTIEAVRALDTKVMRTLGGDVRDTVRAFIENGIRDGANPRATARQLRTVIGLAPSQAEYVENLRRELLDGRIADAKRRQLLDRRFNLDKLAGLSEAERLKRVEVITESYRRRFTAFNAETNARTATLDSLKLGQRLAWDDAIDKGLVQGGDLFKRWVATLDHRLRDEHRAMHGEEVPFRARYSNGEDIPGESTYNCRCVSIVVVKRGGGVAAA